METLLNSGKVKSFEPEKLFKDWNLSTPISKKEQKGLAVIIGHPGKRIVFESYLKTDPQMAIKYLKFISENSSIRYVKYDAVKQKFLPVS